MDEKTKQALNKSIKHWEENAKAECVKQVSTRAGDCALCVLFMFKNYDKIYDVCKGCPVHKVTGRDYCHRTPYERVISLLRNYRSIDPVTPKLRAAIEDELLFLKALRPIE